MNTYASTTKENKAQSAASRISSTKRASQSALQFIDNRPSAIQMRKLQELANRRSNEPKANDFSSYGVVQRSIVDNGGRVDHNRNIAVAWKGGGEYAVTPSVINGKEIPPTSNRVGMILAPELREISNIYHIVDAEQHVGWRMDAPTTGPWQHPNQAPLEELDAFAEAGGYNTPQRSVGGSTPYTLIVRGDPDDTALAISIISHEMHHVAEQAEVINDVLRPWDLQVHQNTAQAGDPLNAWVKYDELGIAPAQDIANTIVDNLKNKGEAYHRTAEGMEPIIKSVVLNNTNHTYTVKLKGRT